MLCTDLTAGGPAGGAREGAANHIPIPEVVINVYGEWLGKGESAKGREGGGVRPTLKIS